MFTINESDVVVETHIYIINRIFGKSTEFHLVWTHSNAIN